MFFDAKAWPPAPGGDPPPAPRPGGGGQRVLGWLIGLVLLALFLGPFAGTSVILAIRALLR